jgi:hypothetical protein
MGVRRQWKRIRWDCQLQDGLVQVGYSNSNSKLPHESNATGQAEELVFRSVHVLGRCCLLGRYLSWEGARSRELCQDSGDKLRRQSYLIRLSVSHWAQQVS